MFIPSLQQAWKWNMASWKTVFLYKPMVFDFHDCFRESTCSIIFHCFAYKILQARGMADVWSTLGCLEPRYPICVDTCPQGELIVCPKNQNRKTTTAEPSSTSTENAYAHYFHSIKESNNGGLPYPPYPSDGAYEQYPPGHAFRYPFYQTPFHYPPPIYPPPIPTGTTWNPENNPTEGLPKSEKVTSVQ